MWSKRKLSQHTKTVGEKECKAVELGKMHKDKGKRNLADQKILPPSLVLHTMKMFP